MIGPTGEVRLRNLSSEVLADLRRDPWSKVASAPYRRRFRLYPGGETHRNQERCAAQCGARFHAPEWWREPRDRDVTSELVDPSRELVAFARPEATYTRLRPVALRVASDFRCDDADAGPVFARSLEEQHNALSLEAYERRLFIYSVRHLPVRLPGPPPQLADL